MHLLHQSIKHLVSSNRFALEVRFDPLLAFRNNQIHRNRVLLSEPPASSHCLVVTLEGVRGEAHNMIAELAIKPPRADLVLYDQVLELSVSECRINLFLLVVIHRTRYLSAILDEAFQQIPLGVEVTPDHRRLPSSRNQFSRFFTTLLNGAASFFTLVSHVRRWNRE